jgi:fatty-acyl-CoA synthase
MHGQMSGVPLTLVHAFGRAEKLFGDGTVTTLTPSGRERITYEAWAHRTRKLAAALHGLGVSADGRVATFRGIRHATWSCTSRCPAAAVSCTP